jgi:hypothetical protein
MTKQTRQFGERAMQFDIKTYHICGKSARKNPQKHTTWWRKIEIWRMLALIFIQHRKRHLHHCLQQAKVPILQK